MRRLVAIVTAALVLTAGAAVAVPPPICLEPVIACPKPPPPAPPKVDVARHYRGLGAWVDSYDWSRELSGRLKPSAVDDMAKRGVKTLYLQAAKDDARVKGTLLSPDLLGQWLERAHANKIHVVAWYLPKFTNPDKDWRHLDAILRFRSNGHAFDSIGVDIESREVKDAKVRSDRLVALSQKLRKATTLPTSAIVVPPVVLDRINPAYWPDFPWQRIKSSYDVWVPMAYYTYRTKQSGYRDAYRYAVENMDLLRRDVGGDVLVHMAAGLAELSSNADYEAFFRGSRERGAIGGSTYDYATTKSSAWDALRKAPGN